MKRIAFALFMITLSTEYIQAQFVTIPDVNFRNALKALYPTCFNASDLMDTTCIQITGEDSLKVNSKNILSLVGIQYFKNLKYLRCENNQLINLSDIPNTLLYLNCGENRLTTLPILPHALSYLDCDNNQLTDLPSLPNTINRLNCDNNLLSSLPVLPNSLTILNCYKNKLTELPALPSSLVSLGCNYNCISHLPSLPSSLSELDCSLNQITNLPPLPNSLYYLSCENNRLTSLSFLPDSLSHLYCYNNQLTKLPSLPNTLIYLWCNNNPLDCLPYLPYSLLELYIKQTNIKCKPNELLGIISDTTLPLCSNPLDVCQVQSFAKGFVYQDTNGNGFFDSIIEIKISNQVINILPNGWKSISDINGDYIVKLDTAINNTWNCVINNKYATVTPSSYSITPTNLSSLPNNYNFGIHFKPNVKDLEATLASSVIRPGFTTNVSVTANNTGTMNQSNITVKLKKPADYNVINSSNPTFSIVNDTLIWDNVSIDFLQSESFYIELQVPIGAVLGTEVEYEAWVNGTQGDTTPIDNYTTWTDTVRGSYDPNDKLVNKTTLPPTYDVEKDRLIYTIRFQNTGTDTAFYVRVKDEMPANLNLSTLRIINASHAYQLIVREKNIVEFAFPNINLPDKTTNEPKSHGFVQFSIQPKAGLPINEKIQNNASIFFDYNAPVITNFAETEIKLLTNIANNKSLAFKLFPNPTNGTIRVELPYNGTGNWVLSDISGRQIMMGNIDNQQIQSIEMSQLPSGTYFITIQLGNEVSTAKVLKM